MNFDDTAKLNGASHEPLHPVLRKPKSQGVWKVVPWAWWPESEADRVAAEVWPGIKDSAAREVS